MNCGNYIATYKGKSLCGFIHKHKYLIKVDKDIYGYSIAGITDLTIDEDTTTAFIRLSSEGSINNYFKVEEGEENV